MLIRRNRRGGGCMRAPESGGAPYDYGCPRPSTYLRPDVTSIATLLRLLFFPLFCIRVFLLFSVRRLVPAAYRCVTHYCIIIMGSFTPYIISRIILSVIAYIIYTLLAPSRGYGFRVRLLYTLHYCRSRTPLSFSCAARTYNTYMGHRQHTPRDRT